MIYIIFDNTVKLKMINHMLYNPNKECGGFLYGNLCRFENDTLCNVNDIYYEKILGGDHDFNFRLSYIVNAKNMLKNLKSELLLGTYHSHGQYQAIFSDVDRNELQRYFGPNKITLIYSPRYSHLIGEFMDENGVSHKAKIITRNNNT